MSQYLISAKIERFFIGQMSPPGDNRSKKRPLQAKKLASAHNLLFLTPCGIHQTQDCYAFRLELEAVDINPARPPNHWSRGLPLHLALGDNLFRARPGHARKRCPGPNFGSMPSPSALKKLSVEELMDIEVT